MASAQRWCRIRIVRSDGTPLVDRVLEGQGRPDLEAVDDVARAALMARRLGVGILVTEASPDMAELLYLAGLRIEVEGKAERGEEPVRVEEVQEEVHPGDPSG